MISEVYLGLGANLGNRVGNIARSVEFLKTVSMYIKVSSLHETKPQGYGEQPPFINAVCLIRTHMGPFELLSKVHRFQIKHTGKKAFPNGPRVLDIDILMYGRMVLRTPILTIPHPRMHTRNFVLGPLLEIAPNLEHPVLKESVSTLSSDLSCSRSDDIQHALQNLRDVQIG